MDGYATDRETRFTRRNGLRPGIFRKQTRTADRVPARLSVRQSVLLPVLLISLLSARPLAASGPASPASPGIYRSETCSGTRPGPQDLLRDSSYLSSVRDSVDRYFERKPGPLKPPENRAVFTPLLSAFYSREESAGLQAGFSLRYRSGLRTDLPYSGLQVQSSFSANRSAAADLGGSHWDRQGRGRLSYRFGFHDRPVRFWGIGFAAGSDPASESTFRETAFRLDAAWHLRLGPSAEWGILAGFRHIRDRDFSRPDLLAGQSGRYRAVLIGTELRTDRRDHPVLPTSGYLLQWTGTAAWSPDCSWHAGSVLIADGYAPLWEGAVLAGDFYAEFHTENTPWQAIAAAGGSERMRGYYTGRFRDRHFITLQAELRQQIHRGHGAAVWAGAGNLFSSFRQFRWNETLPSWGIGYRWYLQGTLLRIDAGFGRFGEWGISAGVNHAF